jgi:hypothetical protein
MSSSQGDYKPPPSWLEEGDLGPNSSHNLKPSGGASSSGPAANANRTSSTSAVLKYKKFIVSGLKLATLGLSGLMLMTALFGLSKVDGFGDLNKMFVGIYMVCFSVMLLLFEIIKIQPMVAIDHMYQRNFGFLYGMALWHYV